MQLRAGPLPDLLQRHAGRELHEAQRTTDEVDDPEVGDDRLHDPLAGQMQVALLDDLVGPVPFTILPGIIQFAISPSFDTCSGIAVD